MFLGCLCAYILDLLQLTMCAGALDHAIYIKKFLIEGFHLPIQIIFRLMVLINRIVTVSQAYSQALLDGLLVGTASKSII